MSFTAKGKKVNTKLKQTTHTVLQKLSPKPTPSPLKDGERGSYGHFLDHKRPTRTPRVKWLFFFFFFFTRKVEHFDKWNPLNDCDLSEEWNKWTDFPLQSGTNWGNGFQYRTCFPTEWNVEGGGIHKMFVESFYFQRVEIMRDILHQYPTGALGGGERVVREGGHENAFCLLPWMT